MKRKKAIAITTLLLLGVACEFDEYRVLVPKERLMGAVKGVCTLTADQKRVIAECEFNEEGRRDKRMRCFDARTGHLMAVHPWEFIGAWEVVAVAPDFEDTDQFWSLHANGMRHNWTEDFVMLENDRPIPDSACPGLISREYYDMDIGKDGTVYITAGDRIRDDIATFLYRKPLGGHWVRETVRNDVGFPLMYKECQVDHDDASGQTLVLDEDNCTVFRFVFDEQFNVLHPVGSVDLPPTCGPGQGGYSDIAAYGNFMTVSTPSRGPNGRKLLEINTLTGDVTDEALFGRPQALAGKGPLLSGQSGEISVFVTGLDYDPGKYAIVELTLKPRGH